MRTPHAKILRRTQTYKAIRYRQAYNAMHRVVIAFVKSFSKSGEYNFLTAPIALDELRKRAVTALTLAHKVKL